MRRRWGAAVLMSFAMAFVMAAASGSAFAEEFTLSGFRAGEALAQAASKELGTVITVDDVISSMPDERSAMRLFNSLSGEMYADMIGTSVNSQREFRRALPSIFSYSQTAHYQDRADAGVASSGGALANFAPENYYTYCPTTMCSPGSKWVMWDVPFLTNETHKREDGYLGYEQSTSGFATGVSRLIGERSAIGVAVGYDRRKLRGRDNYVMENNGDTLHLALYGGTSIGCLFIDGYAGFSRTWNKSKRRAEFPGVGNGESIGEAKLRDNVFSGGFKASYVWILGNDMRITPSLGLDVTHVRMSGGKERGKWGTPNESPALLSIDKSNFTSVAMPIMVSANKTFSSSFLAFKGNDSLWTPEVRGGIVPQFGSKHAKVDTRFNNSNSPTFTAESTRFNRTYGTVGAGLKIKLANKYIFGVDYDYSFSSKWNHHSLTGMYGVSF